MPDDKIGLDGYRGARSRAANVMVLMRRRVALRAELEVISGQISEAVPALNAVEIAELKSMLAGEIADCDTDVALLSQQVASEAALLAPRRRWRSGSTGQPVKRFSKRCCGRSSAMASARHRPS